MKGRKMESMKGRNRWMLVLAMLTALFVAVLSGMKGVYADEYDDEMIDLKSSLVKNKVNVVSWDGDLGSKLQCVYEVYPELKSKVNIINLGVASDDAYYTQALKDVADGKYNGYTIIISATQSDLPEVNNGTYNFPALSKIGFKESDYASSYPYYRNLGTVGGKLKGVTWQAVPGHFFFNVKIAEKVLGTADPEEVQKMISTPQKFNDVAKKMANAGYKMTSGVSSINWASEVPADIGSGMRKLNKTYKSAYDTGDVMWSENWVKDMTSGKVFGYFGAPWMQGVLKGDGVPDGMYGICMGPVSYIWGGTFLFANDRGNQGATAAKVLTALTCDVAAMKLIAIKTGDVVNNQKVNTELIEKKTLANSFYAGKQDAIAVWHAAALALEKETALNGWQKFGKQWYYYVSGMMQKGWKKISGKWYYFTERDGSYQDGSMKTGWKQISGKWYFFKKDGAMASNEWCKGYWLNKNGTWTYKAKASWKKDSKGWWFGDTKGWYAKNQWQKIDNKWYYFDSKGYITTGTKKIGGKSYKFNSSGACLNP